MANINNLPNSKDFEEVVLGSMLLDPRTCLDVLSELNENDFYIERPAYRAVFRALSELNQLNLPIDIHTVADLLKKQQLLDEIGGVDFLVSLTDRVTGLSNINYYISGLKDYSLMRELLTTVEQIKKDAIECKDVDFTSFVGDAERRITEITSKRKITGFRGFNEISSKVLEELNSLKSEKKLRGITTGYHYVDQGINGLQKGSLIILAARPSVGKSAFALNIAYNAAKSTKLPVAFFSLEMTSEEIMRRLFANVANVELDRINKGFLSNDDKLKLRTAQEEIKDVPIYIDDTMGVKLEDLVTKAKKIHSDKGGLGLVVVDYIGKVVVKLKGNDSKNLEIDRVTGALKQLAKDLDVPVLALAQVNRRAEEKPNAEPGLENLRDSGSIEQDADVVMFVHDPNRVKPVDKKKFGENQNAENNSPTNEEKPEDNTQGKLFRILLRKNRNGICPTSFPLLFFKGYQRFSTPSKETYDALSNMDEEF